MKKLLVVLIAVAALIFVFRSIYKSDPKSSTKVQHRPQEPKLPYPYRSEEVTFKNSQANISLSGTLTLPSQKGIYPAVVLITGSGPQDRNEEVVGHKPFLVIADYLTRQGIAVLRYDDRGAYKSSGNFEKASSLDFSDDVESAVSYLKTRKEIDTNKIGLIGHSEGGLIAPIVASRSKDISFIVLLAGPGIRGDSIMLIQGELIGKAMGQSDENIKKTRKVNSGAYKIMLNSKDLKTLRSALTKYMTDYKDIPKDMVPPNMTKEKFISDQINAVSSPWWQFFLKHDPAATLQKVRCPVLALNGGKDLQVSPKENLSAISAALSKANNHHVTFKELPGLNHFFQECETGSPKEYEAIEQTFSPIALTEISTWILKQVR